MGSYSLPGPKGSLSETFPRRDMEKKSPRNNKKNSKQPNAQTLSCAKSLCFAFYLIVCQQMYRLSQRKTQDPFPCTTTFTGKVETKQMEKKKEAEFLCKKQEDKDVQYRCERDG